MKIVENVTIYKCDYCKKELKRKHAMINHEGACSNNPKNHKKCLECKHLSQMNHPVSFEETVYYEGGCEEHYREKEVNVFVCTKKDILMYPYDIERRGLPEKYPVTYEDQAPMPKECEDFKGVGDNSVPGFNWRQP